MVFLRQENMNVLNVRLRLNWKPEVRTTITENMYLFIKTVTNAIGAQDIDVTVVSGKQLITENVFSINANFLCSAKLRKHLFLLPYLYNWSQPRVKIGCSDTNPWGKFVYTLNVSKLFFLCLCLSKIYWKIQIPRND